jgi:hypothetical protein
VLRRVDVVAEARDSAHRLQMWLDTGSNATNLYPLFRSLLTAVESERLGRKENHTGGVGGVVTQLVELAPMVRLEVLDRRVDVKDVTIYPKAPSKGAGNRDGVIGMDALAGGFTLDFRSMQFRLE